MQIKPEVSPTVGPTGANMTIHTVRGAIRSHWTRGADPAVTSPAESSDASLAEPSAAGGRSSQLLRLRVALPIGVSADVTIPLLRSETALITVTAEQLDGGGGGGGGDGRVLLWAGPAAVAAVAPDGRPLGLVRPLWLGSVAEPSDLYSGADGLARLQLRGVSAGGFDFRVHCEAPLPQS